jgi:O-antigen ligase
MNVRARKSVEVPLEDFYALKVGRIATHFTREHFSFWMICVYLFFEYVRPQAIITSIDIAPWATIFLALALVGRVFDKSAKWVSDPANVWITLFMLVILASCFNAIYQDWAWKYFNEMLSWYVVYFLIINTVTSERRLLIFLAIFLMASYKLSFFGARTWIMRGFAFEAWGIQGPPGFFMNSGELTIQMLMFAPVAYCLTMFMRPYLSKVKFWFLMTLPASAALTVLGASSRGSQLGLVYQAYRALLKGRVSFKKILAVAIVAVVGWNLLPEEQKLRFSSAGTDNTSEQRLLYWEHGLEMIRDYPVLGVGFFNFPPYYVDHWPEDLHVRSAQVPHNIFIQVGTDAGLTGLFLFGMLIWRNMKIARDVRAMNLENKPFSALANGYLIALWGFLIAGQFVTVTYYPFFWVNLAMTVSLGNVAARYKRECEAANANTAAASGAPQPVAPVVGAQARLRKTS